MYRDGIILTVLGGGTLRVEWELYLVIKSAAILPPTKSEPIHHFAGAIPDKTIPGINMLPGRYFPHLYRGGLPRDAM